MQLATSVKPRKTPIQARSGVTVDAILEATIHILIEQGIDRLTTTRIATRAGVSIGSLYQYFPNKHALMVAVLERHLAAMLDAMEAACRNLNGGPLRKMGAGLVDAYFAIKWADPEASIALYSIPAELGRNDVVARVLIGFQAAIRQMLATCPRRRFDDIDGVSYILATSLVGPAQSLLGMRAGPADVARARGQLRVMVCAYLQAGSAAAVG